MWGGVRRRPSPTADEATVPDALLEAHVPRAMVAYEAMEIVVTPETTYVLIDHIHDSRRIFTDGCDWSAEIEPSFAGYSIGYWIDQDGDGHYTRHSVSAPAKTIVLHLPSAIPRSDETKLSGDGGVAENLGVMNRVNSGQAARRHIPAALVALVDVIPGDRRRDAENAQGGGDCKHDEGFLSAHGGLLVRCRSRRLQLRTLSRLRTLGQT
jgi:hypothetical protein